MRDAEGRTDPAVAPVVIPPPVADSDGDGVVDDLDKCPARRPASK